MFKNTLKDKPLMLTLLAFY